MKKILFLLIFSVASYGQAILDEGAQLGGNTSTSSTTKIISQEPTTGLLNYINATGLPVSTATANALDLRTENSSGAIQGFAITNNGDGTVNIATGTAYLRTTNDPYSPLIKYVIPAITNLALTDNANNFVLVDYNGGTPALTVTISSGTINTTTNSIAYVISRVGTTLDYISLVGQNVDANGKLRRRFLNSEGLRRAQGAVLTGSNRNLLITAGLYYSGLIEVPTPAFNTSTGSTFTQAYINGTWVRTTGSTQINNTQYSLAGVLTTMPTNDYRVDYVYILADNPSKLYVLLGSTTYANINDARLAPVPTALPSELQFLGTRVGRVIIRKDALTMEVSSEFATIYQAGSATLHNDLGGLNLGDFQHLTVAEKANNELKTNKATNFTTINNTLYPSVQAVKNELDKKQTYGFTVYDKSYWSNLSDFSSTGVTPTIVNQGSVRLSGGSTDMSQYITIPNYANSDENLDIEVLFIVNDINGRSPSIGKKSINSSGDLSGDLTASYDFSTNFIRIDQIAGNATPSGFSVAIGDLCSIKLSQRGSDVLATFTNINQDKSATNSFKFYTTNVSDLVIYNGFSNVDIKKIKVTSATNSSPDVMYIGDSKSQLPLGVNKGNRFANYTSQFGLVDVFAGHGDKTVETLAGLPYILNHIKPKYVVLNQLRNDLANGVSSATYQANYNSIVSQLNAIGATVIHLLPIPETVLDQSAITTFISSNFTNLVNPSAFDPFTQTSDGFHPNDSGSRFLANLIVNSGYIPTVSRFENKNILKTDIDFAKTNKSNIFTLLQDFSTIKLPGTTAQYIRGNGTLATLPTYTIPVGANPTATVGSSVVNGSASTFMRSDASPALNASIDRSWSGIHTFTNAGVPNASIASAALQLSGGIGVTGQSYFGNGMRINGGHNIGNSIYSFGIFGSTTNPSTATTQEISSISLGISTFAGTYTTSFVNLLNLSNGITKGAGHTITYASGLKLSNLTQGTNNANIVVNANSLVGNWSIYNNSAYLNYLGTGNTLINTTTDNTSGAKLQVNGNITATSYSGGATLTGIPTVPTASVGTNTNQIASTAFVKSGLDTKQNTLVSGTNIKTINGNSILGSGDLVIGGGGSQDLQSILDVGASFSYDSGNTNGGIGEGTLNERFVYFTVANGLSGSLRKDSNFSMANGNIVMNANFENTQSEVNISDGALIFGQTEGVFGTSVQFETPSSTSILKYPAKATGTYILATKEEVPIQLKDFYADVNNVSTTETDLLTYTTVANRLNATGEKIISNFSGTFNDVTASSQLKLYFAGNLIGDTGTLTMSVTGAWVTTVSIIRTGTTTARAIVNISTPSASTASYTKYTSLTGVTFTGTNIVKITGTAGGATGGNDDITATYGNIIWQPAAL